MLLANYDTIYDQHVSADVVIKSKTLEHNSFLKKGVWAYFFLLIFEGALRKWALPSLATPLLIIRDPLALLVLFSASRSNLFTWNKYIVAMFIIAVTAFIAALTVGHGNAIVALFGVRILLIHFPFMFVTGRILNADDVIKMGKITLIICIPMTILLALQFYSPQSAWVNRGVGGDIKGGGFGGALGFFRPPGTFSFTNGTSLFYGFAAPFIMYFWLSPTKINKLILILASACLLASIPLSISRTLLFEVILTLLFTVASVAKKPKYAKKVFGVGLALLVLFLILSSTTFFQTATMAFTSRFDQASIDEGGLQGTLVDRFIGGMFGQIANPSDFPFFGNGIGISTNVGIMLLSGSQATMINDVEWGRIIEEMGFFLGLALISIRVLVLLKLTKSSLKNLSKGCVLPWLLLSFGAPIILQGQWAQPTALGFSTLVGGLIIAAFRPVSDKSIQL